MITLEDIKKDPEIDAYFKKTNEYLAELGVIVHDYNHANKAADNSHRILKALGFSDREAELGRIAGYLHDIGNVINKFNHGRIGAALVFPFFYNSGMPPEETAEVLAAIGNHEEKNGIPVSNVSAAVIISDKADVRRDRVRKTDFAAFTTRDRVNYAVERADLLIEAEQRLIKLDITIDLSISSVMEYFEIFLTRMILSKRAARQLRCDFELFINGARFL